MIRRSGWLPAALVALFAVAVVTSYGVPLRQTGVFAAYVTLAVVLPGTLWWRALRGAPRILAEELAAGTALGYAFEVLTYIPARAVGAPWLVLAWPAATIVTFALVPSLRRFWMGPGQDRRVPVWWAWAVAAFVAFGVALSAVTFFRTHGLTWPGNGSPYVDIPWHLSMAADVKHHMPATFPYVLGEPLLYHWFAYADLAATSWVTGIELQTLLFRLWLLPMLASYLVLVAVLARRIGGRWWTGIAALGITCLVLSPQLHSWPTVSAPAGGGAVLPWLSPTQAFGAMLFVPLVLLVTDILRRPAAGRRRWVPAGILLAAVMGAKATFVPLLLAGLALLIVVHLVIRRRLHRPALGAAVGTAVIFVFAQVVIYRGEDQGLRWAPFHAMKWLAEVRPGDDDLLSLAPATPAGPTAQVTLIFCVGWLCVWAGIWGYLRRPALLQDPAVLVLLGIGFAGLGAVVVFGHPGLSELYFLRSAAPYLCVLAACGLGVAASARTAWALLGAAAAGALITWRVDVLGRTASDTTGLLPYLMLGGAVVLSAAALLVVRRRLPVLRGVTLALVLALVTGLGLSSVRATVVRPFESAAALGWRPPATRPSARVLPPGAVKAARWLRDHSTPDDVVATNAHCGRIKPGVCDNRHFWVAAYTERRVVIEGWGYANGVNTRASIYGPPGMGQVPFARPRRLATNDAAFRSPSQWTIGRLSDRFGVRWLFVDERDNQPAEGLGQYAALRYRAGRCAVYEVT